MNKLLRFLLVGFLLPCAYGCDAVSNILRPNTVTVDLINNGDFDVEAHFFIGPDQDTLEALLIEFGDPVDQTVRAGERESFFRDCEDLQAIILENAELRLIGVVGPDTSFEILRDGTDFDCGDTIVFTFDHGPLGLDFNVDVSYR